MSYLFDYEVENLLLFLIKRSENKNDNLRALLTTLFFVFIFLFLHWRAFHIAIRTEYTTIALFWP